MAGAAAAVRTRPGCQNSSVSLKNARTHLSRSRIATAGIGNAASVVRRMQVDNRAATREPSFHGINVFFRMRSILNIVSQDRTVGHKSPALLGIEIAFAG